MTRGVNGRSFPFFFWPLVWGGGALLATDTYLDARREVRSTHRLSLYLKAKILPT